MRNRIIAEYRQTFILRIMATSILLFIAFLGPSETLVVGVSMLSLILVWLWGFKEKIILSPHELRKESLFGSISVPLNARTEYFYKFVQVNIQGIPTGQHTYITVKNGHQQVKANSNIKDVEDLRERLIQIELKNLQPQIEKSLQEKSSLNFGVLKVSASGVAYKNKMLTYSEIEDFGIENGFFYIRKKAVRGNFFKIAVSEIPNMTTFFALLDYYIQQKMVA